MTPDGGSQAVQLAHLLAGPPTSAKALAGSTTCRAHPRVPVARLEVRRASVRARGAGTSDTRGVVTAVDLGSRRASAVRGPPWRPTAQKRPTTLPSASRSIEAAAGCFGSPGMVRISPLMA